MRTVIEPLEGNKVKLSVQIEDSELDRALDQAARKLGREVRMPGFRPGKVPRRVLEARLGAETLRQEALREALPDFYASALREGDVDAIAPPEIDITAGKDDGPVAFDAVVEVRPTVTIPGYSGLEITLERPEATPEELSRQLDRLRNNDAVLNDVTRPARDGDNVTVNLATTRDGQAVDGLTAEDFLYEIGSEAVVPELDEHLRGASVGDIVKFSATIPNGDEIQLEVLVKDVKEKVLPEMTDEWASEASEFATVAELEDDLRTRIESIKRAQIASQLRDRALAALVELVADDPPEALVGAEVDRRLHDLSHRLQAQGATVEQYLEATGTDSATLLSELRTGSVESVKADLALRALCEAEGLGEDEDDLEAEIVRLAESVGRSPAQVRRNLVSADQMPAVRSDVRKAKALSWLMEHVIVVDAHGQPIDRADLEPRAAHPENESHGVEAVPEETTP